MPRNIEIKARLDDLERARAVARRVATSGPEVEDQVDRYYAVSARGSERIKVRSSSARPTELIRYRRAEDEGVRPSDYERIVLGEGALAETTSALGLPILTVAKRREIWHVDNVRVHLDQVEGLGTFLEFEAAVDSGHDDAACRRRIDGLLTEFGIRREDIVPASYSDLLLARD